jgi:drug/metabolite transporter (DMT)-like permease
MGDASYTGYLILALRVLLLAASFPLIKALNRGQSSIAATALFVLVGGALVIPLAAVMISTDPSLLAELPQWIDNSLLSSVIFTSGMILFMWALGRGDVSLLAPLTSLTFIILYVFDLLAGSVGFCWCAPAGIVLVTGGVTLLNLQPGVNIWQALSPMTVLRHPGALGAIYYAFAIAGTRMVDSRVADIAPPLLYATSSNFIVGVLCIGLLLVRRRTGRFAQLWRERRWIAIATGCVGIFGYITLLSCFDYFAPSVIEPFSQLAIVITTLAGAWIYKEKLHWRWLAAILVCGGAALVMLARG